MKAILKKFLLVVLCISKLGIANAQVDSALAKPSFLKQAIIPSVLMSYGALSLGSSSLRQFDRYVDNSTIGQRGYSGSADDYLRYGPVAIVYGLDFVGIKAKNKFIDRSALLLIAMGLTSSVVTFTKKNIHRERPDGSSFSSFPSSHTAMAFMTAEFMHQEYGEKSIWFSVIGYGTATATGALRLYHHAHWFSDVLMGAGYGILATKISYIIYPLVREVFLKNQILVTPLLGKNINGFSISYKLK